MKIIIVSNFLTPHQAPLCEAFNSLPNCEVIFIETYNVDKNSLPIGWRYLDKPSYLVDYGEYISDLLRYQREINEADAVIFGAIPYCFIKERIKNNKPTFFYTERMYKSWRNIVKLPYHLIKYNYLYHHNCVKLLCASAFAYSDFLMIRCFKDRAFKWGYFPEYRGYSELEASLQNASSSEGTTLMWCGRFLRWKHPELPIKLAALLKKNGYVFYVDMYGAGIELEKTKELAEELQVSDVVNFKGNLPNEDIQKAMKEHDIFLFTSDKNEGWGAVSNEAMSNGCVLVGSHLIGSIPYLIKDGINGLVFESGNIESLFKKVIYLIDNPDKRKSMAKEGIMTIKSIWSPIGAATSFVNLVNNLQSTENPFKMEIDGPCSKAEFYKNNWYKTI